MSISSSFWLLLGVSVAGLFVGSWQDLQPLQLFLAGALPLVLYHLRLFAETRRKRDGSPQKTQTLSPTTIDSVYYFGFLVTIGTLAAAVIFSVLGDESRALDLKRLGLQFALGLLATGYALFARIQLTSTARRMDQEDLENEIEAWVERTGAVVGKVQAAGLEFETFTAMIRDAAHRSVTQSAEAASTAMTGLATQYQRDMGGALRESVTAIQDIKAALQEADIAPEVAALKKSLQSTGASLLTLQNRMSRLDERMGALEEGTARATDAVAKQAAESGRMAAAMGAVAALERPIQVLEERIARLSGQVERTLPSVQPVSAALQELAAVATSAAGGMSSSFQGYDAAVARSLAAVSASTAALDSVVRSMGSAEAFAADTRSISAEVRALQENLKALAQEMSQLTGTASSTTGAMASLQEDLRALQARVSAFTDDSRAASAAADTVPRVFAPAKPESA